MLTAKTPLRLLFLTALALVVSTASAGEITGRVTDVTLYRGQALVTRSIPLEQVQGPVEVVVGNLPEQIVSGSLFAETGDGVEVRAVRFRTRAVGEQPRDEVRQLDEAIEAVNEKARILQKGLELLAKRAEYLDKLEGFVAPTAKVELSQGVLNAETLEKLTLFGFEQREAVAKTQIELAQEAKQLEKEMSLLQRKRSELTGGASRTVREAVLFLEKHAEGKQAVRLNYLVSNCGWSPTYTVRAADRKKVGVECNALIHQMTGENWDTVELTLSTASPALSAAGPGLAPFPVTLTPDGKQGKLSQREVSNQLQSFRGRQKSAQTKQLSAFSLEAIIGSSWQFNTVANDLQCLELTNGKDLLSQVRLDTGAEDGPSLSYDLAGKVSLASRSDQQMVRILKTDFASRFYFVATPVLTNYVYREAELKNTGEKDLLAGPIAVYLDGRFVGRSEIPTVARGQTFVIGFGADPQLRCRRELADRSESIQGGNRELAFDYRLVIENYRDEPAMVRLFDRIPHSDRQADVRVTLGEMSDPLSKGELYLRTERPKGILRWDIEVAAGATIEKARIVDYAFKLDFDRNLSLGAIGGGEEADDPAAQEDFEMLHRSRLAH